MSDIAILTKEMTRDFGKVRAVDRLSLEVPSGIVFGFLGPNGSGKTTTIHLLLGLLEPTSGKAEVLGFDTMTQANEIRSKAGALLEHSGVYERLSAIDNLEYFGRIWKMSAADRRARSKELLERMGLWERRNDKVGKWSKGMKTKACGGQDDISQPSISIPRRADLRARSRCSSRIKGGYRIARPPGEDHGVSHDA